MSKPTFCKYCTYWEKGIFTRFGDEFGVCHEVIASSKMVQDTTSKFSKDNIVYTEAYFGCIYFREHSGVLISFENIIDSKTGKPK